MVREHCLGGRRREWGIRDAGRGQSGRSNAGVAERIEGGGSN
jgi:hypothetical protein